MNTHIPSSKEDFSWVAQRFGIPVNEIVSYNSGCCYSKVWVKTKRTADKVKRAVEGQTVNGGWFDGMALGGIAKADGCWEVTV